MIDFSKKYKSLSDQELLNKSQRTCYEKVLAAHGASLSWIPTIIYFSFVGVLVYDFNFDHAVGHPLSPTIAYLIISLPIWFFCFPLFLILISGITIRGYRREAMLRFGAANLKYYHSIIQSVYPNARYHFVFQACASNPFSVNTVLLSVFDNPDVTGIINILYWPESTYSFFLNPYSIGSILTASSDGYTITSEQSSKAILLFNSIDSSTRKTSSFGKDGCSFSLHLYDELSGDMKRVNGYLEGRHNNYPDEKSIYDFIGFLFELKSVYHRKTLVNLSLRSDGNIELVEL